MSDDEDERVERYQIRDPGEGWAGKALIINVMNRSSDYNYRKGSNLDVPKMTEVFEHLNLKVEKTQSEDPTAQQIKDEVIKFRDNLKSEYKGREMDFDMIAVCLMAHGKEGIIFGSDEQEVDLRTDVFQAFSNEKCDVLSGKPRIFFTQACRGEERDWGIDGQSTLKRQVRSNAIYTKPRSFSVIFISRDLGTDSPVQPAKVQKRKAALDDTVRAYSCLENYVAVRSQEGAEFIDCIQKVFLMHAMEDNIDDLLKRVT